MGIGADSIDKTSMWQMQAMSEGYQWHHMTEEERAKHLSADELDELAAMIEAD